MLLMFKPIVTLLDGLRVTGSNALSDGLAYFPAFTDRFNRRFDLSTLLTCLIAAADCGPHPQRPIRTAELHC